MKRPEGHLEGVDIHLFDIVAADTVLVDVVAFEIVAFDPLEQLH